MRKTFASLCLVLATALGSSAQAGDGYGKPPSWTGFYLGAHAGYGSGDWNVDLSHSSGAIHYSDPFANPFQSLKSSDGLLGGLQLGYNKQLGGVVVGFETDVTWTGLEGDGRFTTMPPNFATWDINSKLDMMGTVRGRLGVTSGSFLLYGTAGFAWGKVDTTQATNWFAALGAPSDDVGGRTSGTNYHVGWTAGAGAEWMFARNWTLKAEYLYVDLGQVDYALKGMNKPVGGVPYVETFSSDMSFHTARVGVNYKFND
jgi:outer membrane immunogenic protein